MQDVPSHLRPHMLDHAPPALLEPLENGSPGVLKGWNAAAERDLVSLLSQAGLEHRVAKVGIMDAVGLRLGIVKIQAGVWHTGEFSVARLHSDCQHVLAACFGDDLKCDHLDLWAAVPYEGPDGIKWHWPVFSMSCWRDNYTAVARSGLPPGQLLQSLSMLRYDPLFLRYAADNGIARGEAVFDLAVPELNGWSLDAVPPRPGERLQVMTHGPATSRVVAITIDDGPHPATTSLMLQVLAEQKVRATFFVVGEKIIHHPQLFLDLVGAGHEIGNHCFTNRRLPDLPLNAAAAELGETSRLIEALGRQRCQLMRPPGGNLDERSLRLCTNLGLLPVFWSRNTGDWRPRPPADIARAALTGVKGGDIILMHQGNIESALALREVLAGLRQMGLQPGRVSDLLPDAPLLAGSAPKVLADLRSLGCMHDE